MADAQPIITAQVVCFECGCDEREGCYCDPQELYGAPERFCDVCEEPISSGRLCAAHAPRSGYDWRQELHDEGIREGL